MLPSRIFHIISTCAMSSPHVSIKTSHIGKGMWPPAKCWLSAWSVAANIFSLTTAAMWDLGGNLRNEAGRRYLTATTDRRAIIAVEDGNRRSEFRAERASDHFGMLRAKANRSYSKQKGPLNMRFNTQNCNICAAGSQFSDLQHEFFLKNNCHLLDLSLFNLIIELFLLFKIQ